MLKKFVQILGIVGLFILSQLPLGLAIVLRGENLNPQVILVACLVLFTLAIGIFLLVGYRSGLLTAKFSNWFSSRNALVAILGFIAMLALSFLGSFVMSLEGADTTVNQAAIEELVKQLPKILMFLAIVILAPLGEEILCRGLIPDLFGETYKPIGYVIGTFIFAILHGPTNIGSWVIYGGMGAVLAVIRHKTKHLEYSIMAHGLNNLIGFLAILFA